MNEKKEYKPAEIKVGMPDRDMLISSGGSLGEDDWDSFSFGSL